LETFNGNIEWKQDCIQFNEVTIGVFKILPAVVKPIIAKKDWSRQIIKNGEIYYRYSGRSQKIGFSELENIINSRIAAVNQQWMYLLEKIGNAGPQNSAVIDTEKSLIHQDDSKIMIIDDDLARKLKFIKEGEFNETKGAVTLNKVSR